MYLTVEESTPFLNSQPRRLLSQNRQAAGVDNRISNRAACSEDLRHRSEKALRMSMRISLSHLPTVAACRFQGKRMEE
jgi:hypothetical protein